MDRYTHDSQCFVFSDGSVVKVTPDGYSKIQSSDLKTWSDTLIPIPYETMPNSFRQEGKDLIHDTNRKFISPLERVIMNTSRVNWRIEMEARATGDAKEDKKYFEENRFTLRGPRLTAEEQEEQERNFRAKCFAIGYMIHFYKDASFAKCVYSINIPGKYCLGKSFLFDTLENYNFVKYINIKGNNNELYDNSLIKRDSWNISDKEKNFSIHDYYTEICGKTKIKIKNKILELTFENSPTVVFDAQNLPKDYKNTKRLALYIITSDWYYFISHENKHDIQDDFRDEFESGVICSLDRYSLHARIADINFLLSCLHFYLYYHCVRKTTVLTPPMEKVNHRINESSYGDAFEEWAASYFDETNGDNFNIKIRQDTMYDDFINSQFLNKTSYSMISFTKSLRAYCRAKGYDINPQDEPSINVREDGRIIERVPMGIKDGGKIKNWYYIRKNGILTNGNGNSNGNINKMKETTNNDNSKELLIARLDEKEKLLSEKEERIKEKDAQIKELLSILKTTNSHV